MTGNTRADGILEHLHALAAWRSEDPPEDLRETILDANLAIAQLALQVRFLEADLQEATDAATEWLERGLDATKRAGEQRADGSPIEAARFHELSQIALRRHRLYRAAALSARDAIAIQTRLSMQLRDGRRAARDRWEPIAVGAAQGRTTTATG